MSAALPVILDTDPGLGSPGSDIDDGLAIALAVRSAELDVLGLTIVAGNVDLDVGVDVARRLTARLDHPDLPVVAGAASPLKRDMTSVRRLFTAASLHAPATRGAESIGPTISTHAADWMADQVAARPGEITVIAIGPMTNIALAIQRSPGFARDVRELVLMAGSATTYAQNVTVVGDFNSYVDPEALQVVLESGARVRMVGLDQTSRVLLTREDALQLASGDGFARWVAECTAAWIDFLGVAFPNRPEHRSACFLHDPLVVAAVIDEAILEWADADVQVETTSELARGLVVADRGLSLVRPRAANARVAVDTDVEAFRRLFMARITQTDQVEPRRR